MPGSIAANALDLSAFLDDGNDEGMVLCPVCIAEWKAKGKPVGAGHFNDYDMAEQVHLGPVNIVQDQLEITVSRDSIVPKVTKHGGRGALIRLAMYCESGHTFELHLHFHKGTTYLSTHIGAEYDPATDSPAELWRD